MPLLQTSTTLITAALLETGTISPGEPVEQSLMNWGLDKLNRMIDAWGAQELMIFAQQFQQFTLVPNLQPHTIGVVQYSGAVTNISATGGTVTLTLVSNNLLPGTVVIYTGATTNTGLNNQQVTLITSTPTSATFKFAGSITNGADTGLVSIIGANSSTPVPTFSILGNRPEKIVAANLIINSVSPSYNIPLNIRDADWWASQRIQGLTSSYPTDLYYEPDWPNGSLYIWPIPTTNYPIQLQSWTQIQQFNINQTFTMPPAYWDAVVWSLAESLMAGIPPEDPNTVQLIVKAAAAARDKVMVANTKSPRISTGGDGLPSGGMGRPSFDWRTGFNVGTWSGSGR
jgi:hypothetical protein